MYEYFDRKISQTSRLIENTQVMRRQWASYGCIKCHWQTAKNVATLAGSSEVVSKNRDTQTQTLYGH